ncbi:hypothetical protein LY474_06285 [Myxococcus stipitatus]|uniref:hypothetical protein n=1 Tax=Myxococcus stipitatus TaxID=83455 RepID=UPI001F1C860F|nr:hypothetical protein [Myxococcus stipitatus]MCE9667419.1 hypothetical protein [Myxococcus stipitatus]
MRRVSFNLILARWLALCLGIVGTQAFAEYAPLDGVVLFGQETSNRYIVAGGTPFYIPPSQWSVYSSAITIVTPQATINSYERVPREGTLFRQYNFPNTIYVVVGKRYWLIPTTTELGYWNNLGFKPIFDLPSSAWSEHFLDYSYKVLVAERSTSQVYLWISGAKYPITNTSDLDYFGGSASVREVPLGSLAAFTHQPECGTRLRERSSSTVYDMSYHLPDPNSPMYKSPSTLAEHGTVPDGSLAPFPNFVGGACIW